MNRRKFLALGAGVLVAPKGLVAPPVSYRVVFMTGPAPSETIRICDCKFWTCTDPPHTGFTHGTWERRPNSARGVPSK